MSQSPQRPELIINYCPKLDLRIALACANRYTGISDPEYRFEVECRLRHPSGSLTYSVSDLCFDLESFARFSQELHDLQQGLTSEAALKNVGEMTVLRLEGNSRGLRATLDIREYLAPEMARLTAALDVEYDLFVNKLRGELERFLQELRHVELSAPE